MPSSKAAASERARRTLRYVEPLSAARTPLADFFSILLAAKGLFRRRQFAFDRCSDGNQSIRGGGFKP